MDEDLDLSTLLDGVELIDSLNLHSNDWCEQCRNLRADLEQLKNERSLDFTTFRQKIISTDLLISKYKKKCDEYDLQTKSLQVLNEKLSKKDMECHMLQNQVRSAIEENAPLKCSKDVLERDLAKSKSTIEELQNKLRSAEILKCQYENLMKTSNVNSIRAEQKEASRKISSLEQKIRSQEKTINKLKDSSNQMKTQLSDMDMTKNQLEIDLAISLDKIETLQRQHDVTIDIKPGKLQEMEDTFSREENNNDTIEDLSCSSDDECPSMLDDIFNDFVIHSLSPLPSTPHRKMYDSAVHTTNYISDIDLPPEPPVLEAAVSAEVNNIRGLRRGTEEFTPRLAGTDEEKSVKHDSKVVETETSINNSEYSNTNVVNYEYKNTATNSPVAKEDSLPLKDARNVARGFKISQNLNLKLDASENSTAAMIDLEKLQHFDKLQHLDKLQHHDRKFEVNEDNNSPRNFMLINSEIKSEYQAGDQFGSIDQLPIYSNVTCPDVCIQPQNKQMQDMPEDRAKEEASTSSYASSSRETSHHQETLDKPISGSIITRSKTNLSDTLPNSESLDPINSPKTFYTGCKIRNEEMMCSILKGFKNDENENAADAEVEMIESRKFKDGFKSISHHCKKSQNDHDLPVLPSFPAHSPLTLSPILLHHLPPLSPLPPTPSHLKISYHGRGETKTSFMRSSKNESTIHSKVVNIKRMFKKKRKNVSSLKTSKLSNSKCKEPFTNNNFDFEIKLKTDPRSVPNVSSRDSDDVITPKFTSYDTEVGKEQANHKVGGNEKGNVPSASLSSKDIRLYLETCDLSSSESCNHVIQSIRSDSTNVVIIEMVQFIIKNLKAHNCKLHIRIAPNRKSSIEATSEEQTSSCDKQQSRIQISQNERVLLKFLSSVDESCPDRGIFETLCAEMWKMMFHDSTSRHISIHSHVRFLSAVCRCKDAHQILRTFIYTFVLRHWSVMEHLLAVLNVWPEVLFKPDKVCSLILDAMEIALSKALKKSSVSKSTQSMMKKYLDNLCNIKCSTVPPTKEFCDKTLEHLKSVSKMAECPQQKEMVFDSVQALFLVISYETCYDAVDIITSRFFPLIKTLITQNTSVATTHLLPSFFSILIYRLMQEKPVPSESQITFLMDTVVQHFCFEKGSRHMPLSCQLEATKMLIALGKWYPSESVHNLKKWLTSQKTVSNEVKSIVNKFCRMYPQESRPLTEMSNLCITDL